MKQELASIELTHLVRELQAVVGGKIDKIYQPEKDELLFQIYRQKEGKRVLRVLPGRFIYLASRKSESPQRPFGYCVFLRKYLNNADILSLSQLGSERIVRIVLQTRRDGKTYHLYIELFGKGNVILCDANDTILSPLETQVWKDRVVRAKEHYVFPKQGADFLLIGRKGLAELLKASNKESLVKALALDLGLGGVYAEEACLLAGMDKGRAPALSGAEADRLFAVLENLRSHAPEPCVVKKGDEVVDIVPFPLKRYEGLACIKHASYCEALDGVLAEKGIAEKKEERKKVETKAAGKFTAIIEAQSRQLEQMRKEAEECQRAGELIYEHYHLIEEILREVRKAREKLSWKEIKERLKGHKLIKDVNEKEGTITVELG